MDSLNAIKENVISGDVAMVVSESEKALKEGVDAHDILEKGLIGGMVIVGESFRNGDMFLPEVIISSKAMHQGLDIVRPQLSKSRDSLKGKVVIGTVEGDIHDIGKKIVSTLIEGNGFDVIDLGVDLKPDVFIKAVKDHKPDILGMSAMLTTTMVNMKRVIDLLHEEGLREGLKILIGGAPVNEDFAKSIGADGYAADAGIAAEMVRNILI